MIFVNTLSTWRKGVKAPDEETQLDWLPRGGNTAGVAAWRDRPYPRHGRGVKHIFHPSIFREYDIRGVVGETLCASDAEALGRAFGTMIRRGGGSSICVGYDGRLSSPDLEAALVIGLRSSGVEVCRVGCGPTPMVYYATLSTGAAAGVMVTGSHNPPSHNGFKMVLGNRSLSIAEMNELGRIAADGDFDSASTGAVADIAIADAYVARLARDVEIGRDLTVVWDAGNGATAEVTTALSRHLPGRHTLINATIDGHFPAHHADPSDPRNLEQLIAEVRRVRADLGIAFDADGDRIGVVDGQGRILWGDQILMLLAQGVLAANPGALILADVKSSQALFDHIAALGGQSEMCRTGHSTIKARMAETGALLAGEMSGHIFFADRYFGYDDALYAAVRLLNQIATWGDQSVAEWLNGLPRLLSTPELRIPCPGDRRYAIVDEIRTRLVARGDHPITIDGVRVTTQDGWWLLRASNTLGVLVARCESNSIPGLNRLYATLRQELAQAGLELPEG